MSKINQAADYINQLATHYAGMVQVAAVLTELGSFDNARKELIESLAAARAEVETAKVDLADAKDAVKKQKDKLKADAQKAADDAEDVLRKAGESAAAIIADAEIKAQIARQNAVSTASTELASILKRTNDAEKTLADTENLIAQMAQERSDLTVELETLQLKLDQTKAAVLKLLGDHQ